MKKTEKEYEETIEVQEIQIEKLLVKQRKLKQKIAELKESPDINFHLIDSVRKILSVNAVLKEILANTETLNQAKFAELQRAIKRTFEIIKRAGEKNDDRKKIAEGGR